MSEAGPPPAGPRRRWLRLAMSGLGALVVGTALVLLLPNLWVQVTTSDLIFGHPGDVPARRAAIVPGASVRPDGTLSTALEARLHAGYALYRAGRVDKILVSGIGDQRYYDEVRPMARWLDGRGVPAEDIFIDPHGRRTLDTMERAAKVYLIEGAIVCTQEYHLPRALFLARRAGLDAVGLVAGRTGRRVAGRDQVREFFARIRAVLDACVLQTPAAVLGDPIPIDGDGRATRDLPRPVSPPTP